MRFFSLLLSFGIMTILLSCQRSNQDDSGIQEEEEYRSRDIRPSRDLKTPDQMDFDRGLMRRDHF